MHSFVDVVFSVGRLLKAGDLSALQSFVKEKEIPDERICTSEVFEFACTHSTLEICKWIHDLFPYERVSMKQRDDIFFRKACTAGNLDIAVWLMTLTGDRYKIVDVFTNTRNDTPVIKFIIDRHNNFEIKHKDGEVCCICQDTLSRVELKKCGHQFCKECIFNWLNTHDTCPLCRTFINTGSHFQEEKPVRTPAWKGPLVI